MSAERILTERNSADFLDKAGLLLKIGKTASEYHFAYLRSSSDLKPAIADPEIPMLVAFAMYQKLSGRSIGTLEKDNVFEAAVLIYNSIVKGDDHLDNGHEDSPKTAFNKTNDRDLKENTGEMYEKAIDLIATNKHLNQDQTEYITKKIKTAWNAYISSENQIRNLDRSLKPPEQIFAEMIEARNSGFRLMGEALTSLLNGSDCLDPVYQDYEKQMGAVVLATGVIDDCADRIKDQNSGNITPTLVGDILDNLNGRRVGETAENLLNSYLGEIKSQKLRKMVLACKGYMPATEAVFERANNFNT